MELSCPICNNSDKLELVRKQQDLRVRNEPITVDMEYYKCTECGEEFVVPDLDNDPLEIAYRIYRAKHGMLQPEEIRDFRSKYHLTQSELANLLGLGGATISRYETGKLQDETHDTLLRLVMDSTKLRGLVANSVGVFDERKKKRVLNAIEESSEPKVSSLEHFITFNFHSYDPDEYSGFKKFDINKFLNAILYFCKGGVLKTKLNKLLFYADFKHFKEYTVSITGARYARVPFGPAPDGYDLYYPVLIRQGALGIEELVFPQYTGEKLVAVSEPNLNNFSESELRILASVKEYFASHNASEISNYSHQEKGYQDTETGELISYSYAQYLRL
jgi:putative zinc finger/helix-turn-helix YgiT family protein